LWLVCSVLADKNPKQEDMLISLVLAFQVIAAIPFLESHQFLVPALTTRDTSSPVTIVTNHTRSTPR